VRVVFATEIGVENAAQGTSGKHFFEAAMESTRPLLEDAAELAANAVNIFKESIHLVVVDIQRFFAENVLTCSGSFDTTMSMEAAWGTDANTVDLKAREELIYGVCILRSDGRAGCLDRWC
jgi:hypothetical protein